MKQGLGIEGRGWEGGGFQRRMCPFHDGGNVPVQTATHYSLMCEGKKEVKGRGVKRGERGSREQGSLDTQGKPFIVS